jgi:aspartyl-tRNA(Asn)/glutamyl-tRNA(Gln) amidotransferase subunit C
MPVTPNGIAVLHPAQSLASAAPGLLGRGDPLALEPMSVDKATVRRIAKLAHIALPEERVEPMMAELNGILGWIEQLQEVDIEGVEPMTSVVAQKLKMRDDVVTAGGDASAIVGNAPLTEDNFFVVPKVVE